MKCRGTPGTSVVASDGNSPDPNSGSGSDSQSGDVAEFKGQFIVDFIAGTVQDDEPPRYDTITVGDYFEQRLREVYE